MLSCMSYRSRQYVIFDLLNTCTHSPRKFDNVQNHEIHRRTKTKQKIGFILTAPIKIIRIAGGFEPECHCNYFSILKADFLCILKWRKCFPPSSAASNLFLWLFDRIPSVLFRCCKNIQIVDYLNSSPSAMDFFYYEQLWVSKARSPLISCWWVSFNPIPWWRGAILTLIQNQHPVPFVYSSIFKSWWVVSQSFLYSYVYCFFPSFGFFFLRSRISSGGWSGCWSHTVRTCGSPPRRGPAPPTSSSVAPAGANLRKGPPRFEENPSDDIWTIVVWL